MNFFAPLALSLSCTLLFAPLAQAEFGAIAPSAGQDQNLNIAMDMMQLNSSLLRNGDNVWERVREGFQIPEVNADIVRQQERFYAGKPEYFRRTLDRSRKYLFHIMNEVERRGMPTEIALLPLVESAFVPSARSPVGASGLWQFMPATGRQYGLEQTWWYDGRRDVTEATRAALDYLEKLYAQFGDWNIALAAYNWGEGNVARAIARLQANGQEVTYENINMPNETRNYAPKLLAVRNILSNPEKFGVHLSKFPNKPYFVSVSTGKHMDVDIAAKLAGMSIAEFKELNPAFNLPVYAHKAGRQMLIPAQKADKFQANLEKWDKPLLSWEVYTPQSEVNISEVAKEYGMNRSQLMAANNLSSQTLKAGQPILVALNKNSDHLPTLNLAAPVTVASNTPSPASFNQTNKTASTTSDSKPTVVALNASANKNSNKDNSYTVTNGDTLFSIARRYSLNQSDIKTLNKLDDAGNLAVGQVLTLNKATRNDDDGLLKVGEIRTIKRQGTGNVPLEYVVQRGDTIASIARRFGIKQNDIQRWNNSLRVTRLQPGQRVLIQGS
ncbi:LysM peptidoglycan-binding domain-containing protein [Neisseriaceae bacterium TC5R-5]|nr:LysM peptidoglycan-binding domain-containing protein [Neisseriaceae bacterium TC5R-5]